METQSASKPISKGICAFCKSEVAKNKMTQHFKFCKQRLVSIASQEEKSQEAKTRLFHILTEGRYNPQYWLHFEVPASESLWSIDDFLKDMWIDDLDHLSGFTINGTDYSNAYPDDYISFGEGTEEDVTEGEEEVVQDEQAAISQIIDEIISTYLKGMDYMAGSEGIVHIDISAWLSELKKPRSTDELIDYLKAELPRLLKEERHALYHKEGMSKEEASKAYFTAHYQKLIVQSLLEEVEDRSMNVLLGRVLKVGQKFSYIYDYGSSTHINLKVIGEREGIVQNKKEPVQLLAQNTTPAFACIVCGKPGTQVTLGYYGESIADSVYCDACAEREVEEGRTLPIINSPRVGVL